jgi:hypothetical protein
MSFETELKELFERHNVRIFSTYRDFDKHKAVEFSYETPDGFYKYFRIEDNEDQESLEYIGEK